jgi:hypothetical protein
MQEYTKYVHNKLVLRRLFSAATLMARHVINQQQFDCMERAKSLIWPHAAGQPKKLSSNWPTDRLMTSVAEISDEFTERLLNDWLSDVSTDRRSIEV